MKKKLANSLNVLYQDVVNKNARADIDSPKYIEAKDFVETYYPRLNNSVIEFLAIYMCAHPKGTVGFYPAKGATVDMLCQYADTMRLVSYNEAGAIVKDETSANVPSQRGE